MHVLGKVFVVLVAILAVVSVYCSHKVLDYRNAWVKKLSVKQQEIVQLDGQVQQARKDLLRLKGDYDRAMLGWGHYWDHVAASNPDPSGTIVLELGSEHLTQKDAQGQDIPPLVHVFQPVPEGGYEYVGEFKAPRVDAGRSTFVATWRVRPGEVANWKPGPDWRVRTLIPDAEKARFVDLEAHLAVEDELLQAMQADLARQEELHALATDHLQLRMGELEGFPDLQPQKDKLPQDLIQGAHGALVDEEEARNAALATADSLRRDLQTTARRVEEVMELNSRLAESLKKNAAAKGPLTDASNP